MDRRWCGTLVLLIALVPACGTGQETSPATTGTGGDSPAAVDDGGEPRGVGNTATDGSPDHVRTAAAIERPASLPWSDPRAMAIEVLTRCQGHDLQALLAVATDENLGHRLEPATDATVAATIFGADSWRTHAISAWSGQISAVRVSHAEARVRFADLAADEVAVVVLIREDSQWRFDDIGSHERATYERWGRAR